MLDNFPIKPRQVYANYCMFSNAIGVNVQVYTSNIMINIQDRLHMDCYYRNCYNNFISAIFILN